MVIFFPCCFQTTELIPLTGMGNRTRPVAAGVSHLECTSNIILVSIIIL